MFLVEFLVVEELAARVGGIGRGRHMRRREWL
jgi:hypothetical protein